METHRTHETRKKFVKPQVICFGQMHEIVMQSYPSPGPVRFDGRGRISQGTAKDFFGN
ncbi:MAG: hypothetical protein ACOX6M_11485 [Armatimonadota bacterium]|jgi:hypothetical protein